MRWVAMVPADDEMQGKLPPKGMLRVRRMWDQDVSVYAVWPVAIPWRAWWFMRCWFMGFWYERRKVEMLRELYDLRLECNRLRERNTILSIQKDVAVETLARMFPSEKESQGPPE